MQITKKFSNIFLLQTFVLVVCTLVLSSLLLKGISLFVNRSFNKTAFTLLVKTPASAEIVHLDRELKSIEIFPIPDLKIPGSSILSNSFFLMVPIDGTMTVKKNKVDDKSIFSLGFILRAITNKSEIKLTGLNDFDLFQMYFFAKGLRSSDIVLTTLKKDTFENGESVPSVLIDSIKNKDIINEGKDIEIDNATEVDGLGAKVAQMLKNEGFNIVITTSKNRSNTSRISFRGDVSETLKRLEKNFGVVGVESAGNSIADIIVVIGEDIAKKLNN